MFKHFVKFKAFVQKIRWYFTLISSDFCKYNSIIYMHYILIEFLLILTNNLDNIILIALNSNAYILLSKKYSLQ